MTALPDEAEPTGGPWAIPHNLDHFAPTPSEVEGASISQFFLGWFSDDFPSNGLVGKTEEDDYTIRRMLHSYELVQDAFYWAADGGIPEEGEYADVLAHAIYLAEGLSLLALKYKAELEQVIDEDNEPWKNGGDA